jgi:hypothetical protein
MKQERVPEPMPHEVLLMKVTIQREVIKAILGQGFDDKREVAKWIDDNSSKFRIIFERQFSANPEELKRRYEKDLVSLVAEIVAEMDESSTLV